VKPASKTRNGASHDEAAIFSLSSSEGGEGRGKEADALRTRFPSPQPSNGTTEELEQHESCPLCGPLPAKRAPRLGEEREPAKVAGSAPRDVAGETVRWGRVLVCFAVKEEAGPFQRRMRGRALLETLLTGMGARNAAGSLRAALEWEPPQLVLSCGFAGALRPGLASGTVMFAAEAESALAKALAAAGAHPGRFHCADRVASTAAEKRALRESTQADAVEMESQIICDACRRQNIACAVVRVILDSAEEDLPLDFNLLMTPKQKLDNRKLATALLKSPGKIGALLKLQKQSKAAAERLAQVLVKVL